MFRPLFKIQTIDYPYSAFYRPNKVQKLYHANKSNRDLILKARRHGITTMIQLDFLDAIMTKKDINCLTIADNLFHAHEIFAKVEYAFKFLPEELKKAYQIETNNVSKLRFGLTDSQIIVLTSGRSGTVHNLHISEYAHMNSHQQLEVMTGSIEAVPQNGVVTIETTANGRDGFYELYQDAKRGRNNWNPHFYPWYLNEVNTSIAPKDDKWLQDLDRLTKEYNLVTNIGEKLNLTREQVYWYYLKAKDLKQYVMQEYPTIDEECFLTTSNNVFDSFILKSYPYTTPLIKRENNALQIYSPPIKDSVYILGCDVGEGGLNSDYSTIIVLDVNRNEVVVKYRNRIKDYLFAKVIFDLAREYNEAYVAVERNNHGHSVINSLLNEYNYRKQYKTEDGKYGFMTTAKTKVDMILGDMGLDKAIYNKEIELNDNELITELLNFEIKDNGSLGSKDGTHDDLVIALAIAHFLRGWAIKKGRGTGMFSLDY